MFVFVVNYIILKLANEKSLTKYRENSKIYIFYNKKIIKSMISIKLNSVNSRYNWIKILSFPRTLP